MLLVANKSIMANKPRVVVVGAGFGGLELCKALRKEAVEVLLIDKNNYHTFIPLLYQVATGGLEAGSVAYPVRRVFRKNKYVKFQMATVDKVDIAQQCLQTSVGTIDYDYLVLATGSNTNFFDFATKQANFLTLKSVPDALNIRSYVMQNLEKAIATQDANKQGQLMNIAIVGGGPSGVELAGALGEMKRYVFPKDFPQIDFDRMSITLFEAAPKLLSSMAEQSSEKCLLYLQKLGIEVRLNTQVKDYDNQAVLLSDGSTFETETVIWAAGVKGEMPAGIDAAYIARGNRIMVDKQNQIEGLQNIFAIGDIAYFPTEDYPKGLPMLAPVAMQQGQHLAKNIANLLHNKPLKPFVYSNKGSMAIIGRNKAVVELPKFKFQGTFAWLVWMFVHIMSLVGFRNKLVAFLDWTQNYFSYDRPLGLVVRPFYKNKEQEESSKGTPVQ